MLASVLNTAKTKFPTNNLVLKTLKDVQSDSLSAILAEASKSYEAKDYKQAIEKYLSVNPANEDSLLGVAASYQALENFDKAIEYYKKAEQVSPKNAEIPYYIGYLYSEQKNWNDAEFYLKKSLAVISQKNLRKSNRLKMLFLLWLINIKHCLMQNLKTRQMCLKKDLQREKLLMIFFLMHLQYAVKQQHVCLV